MIPAIEFRNLEVRSPQGRLLLNGISLVLGEGSVTAILGRSGSGKTTLLRTVNRMAEPSAGAVLVKGRDVREAELISLRRGMGYVIQETGLFPHFTVERNVGLVLEAQGRPREERMRRSRELLAAVGLDGESYAGRHPHQLSGGQRQRVGLARALAGDPAILLMDEPFGALDPLTRAEMQDMLRGLLARLNTGIPSDGSSSLGRKTVLLVTHDLDEALYLGDRIVLLHEGRVIADLPPDEFMRSEQQEIVAYIRAFHRGELGRKEARP